MNLLILTMQTYYLGYDTENAINSLGKVHSEKMHDGETQNRKKEN